LIIAYINTMNSQVASQSDTVNGSSVTELNQTLYTQPHSTHILESNNIPVIEQNQTVPVFESDQIVPIVNFNRPIPYIEDVQMVPTKIYTKEYNIAPIFHKITRANSYLKLFSKHNNFNSFTIKNRCNNPIYVTITNDNLVQQFYILSRKSYRVTIENAIVLVTASLQNLNRQVTLRNIEARHNDKLTIYSTN